ncbi:MAG: hypothetical protein IE919_19755 [Thioclava sp.]|nr:hypothetical protein [Thioclava sp.]MBD3805443.1 hypothetical protein [Thioclava sp.]
MKRIIVATIMSLLAGGAFAADADEPVKVLMEMAASNAAVEPGPNAVYADYFAPGMLLMYFSDGFVRDFTTALLKQKEGRSQVLIDWDPVIGGQDGCAPKDVTYGKPETKGAVTEVLVGFKRSWCYEADAETKDEVTQVTYRLVEESDETGEKRFVIDDIHFANDVPLRVELQELAK